jgi:hypothetical protein
MSLSEKQIKVINDLFEASGDEATVLSKYNISHKLWHKWLNNKDFVGGITTKLESSKRAGQILLAKYNSLAAAKLVQLCDSKNPETSRKACLGIIELETELKQAGGTAKEQATETAPSLDPATASKLLAVLAENNTK